MASRRGARRIEHLGSAHDDQELEALKAAARQRLAGGQGELELGLDALPHLNRGLLRITTRSPSRYAGSSGPAKALHIVLVTAAGIGDGAWVRTLHGPSPAVKQS